jgi:hypothetical protein
LCIYAIYIKIYLTGNKGVILKGVAIKKGRSDALLIIDGKLFRVSEYLDEVAMDVLQLSKNENRMCDLNNQIEGVRAVLNKLIDVSDNLHKNNLIIRASMILDELLNLYYLQDKQCP